MGVTQRMSKYWVDWSNPTEPKIKPWAFDTRPGAFNLEDYPVPMRFIDCKAEIAEKAHAEKSRIQSKADEEKAQWQEVINRTRALRVGDIL